MEKEINIKDIEEVMIVPAVVVEKSETSTFLTKCKNFLIKIKKVRPVVSKNSKKNLILLDPKKKSEIEKIIKPENLEDYKIIKKASDFSYQELLSKIIKDKKKIPSSFEIIGNIAIINLRHSEQLSHKKKKSEKQY